MEIKIFNDIFDQDLGIYWKGNEYYPSESLNDLDKKKLKNMACIELSIYRDISFNNSFDVLFAKYDAIIKTIIPLNSFIVKTEHKKQIKNRIRSYKGIFPRKKVKENDFREIEVSIEGEYTLLLGIAKLNEGIMDLFEDRATSFIISSPKTDLVKSDFIQKIADVCMYHAGTSRINYLNLLSKLLNDDDIIYRISGDGGEELIALQIISNSKNKESLIEKINLVCADF